MPDVTEPENLNGRPPSNAVAEGELLTALFPPRIPGVEDASEARKRNRDYADLPTDRLVPLPVAGPLIAYASPDSTFAVTRRLIDAARRTVVIGISDFTASHVLDLFKRALGSEVRVTLLRVNRSSGREGAPFRDFALVIDNAVEVPAA